MYLRSWGGGCCTPCTLEIFYRLIPPHINDIVNPSIPSKPRLCAGFGLNMLKYAFTSPPPILEVKGKAIHRNKTGQTDIEGYYPFSVTLEIWLITITLLLG